MARVARNDRGGIAQKRTLSPMTRTNSESPVVKKTLSPVRTSNTRRRTSKDKYLTPANGRTRNGKINNKDKHEIPGMKMTYPNTKR